MMSSSGIPLMSPSPNILLPNYLTTTTTTTTSTSTSTSPSLIPHTPTTLPRSIGTPKTPRSSRLGDSDDDDDLCTKCKRPRNLVLITKSCDVSPLLPLPLPKKILIDRDGMSKDKEARAEFPQRIELSIENLPTEILVYVLKYVATDTKSIFTLEAVSTWWQKLARSVVTKVCMADFRRSQSPLYTPNLSRRTKALRGSLARAPSWRKRYSKDLVDDLFVWRIISRYGVGNIRVLDLSGCGNISNRLLHHLSSVARNLTSLDLTCCTSLTESGLSHLPSLPRLKKLDLTGCSSITESGIRHLMGIKTLEKLVLWGTQISDESFSYIAQCDSLHSLYLYPLSGSGTITTKGTNYLVTSSLRSIHLYGEFITDSFLKIFIAPIYLESLHIHYPHPIDFQGSDIIPLLLCMPPSFKTLSLSGLFPNFDRVKLQNDLAGLKSLVDHIEVIFE